jgi:hypothetical protein
VATRKNSGTGTAKKGRRKNPRALPPAILFWLAFFIIMTGLFLIKRETIRANFNILAQRLNLPQFSLSGGEKKPPADPEEKPLPPEKPEEAPGRRNPAVEAPAAAKPAEEKPPAPPPAAPPAAPQPDKAPETPAQNRPAAQPPKTEPAAKPAAPETRERNIYFTQVDKDGAILRIKVSRKISASDSPMLDSLNALLAGPSPEEERRGLKTLIPQGTRVLSAVVRGSTAYISFSEDFQYNTYGVEGYAGQLKQIVWTVTEFSNIRDVQILVEGRRIDYLGEGIWIGSPVNRDSI